MAGIPAIEEIKRNDEPLWYWRGTYAPDPISKLATQLDVLGTTQRYFQRTDDKRFSCRARFIYGDDWLHLIWQYRKNAGGNAFLVKVHTVLKSCGHDFAADFIPGWDGLKITHGLSRHNLSEWKTGARVCGILEAITATAEALTASIVDVTR